MKECAKATLKWNLQKFVAKDAKEIEEKKIKPYEVVESEENCLLNEGMAELIDIICGLGAPTAWNAANARIGVGNDGTGPLPAQSGLLGASKLWKGMNGGYPQRSGSTQAIWQADFIDTEAEFAWLEETIVNATDDTGKNLCRQNTDLGVKPAGQTWRLSGTITFS